MHNSSKNNVLWDGDFCFCNYPTNIDIQYMFVGVVYIKFILGSIIADRGQIFYFGPQVFQASSFRKSDDSRKARQC